MKIANLIGQITKSELKLSDVRGETYPELDFHVKLSAGGVTYSYSLREELWHESTQYYIRGNEIEKITSHSQGLKAIIDILDTKSFNDVEGRYIRCIMTHPHCGAQIRGIGHIMESKFLITPHWDEEIKTYDIPSYYFGQVGKYTDAKEYEQ